ncbi:endo-1,4-beta-xylanase [Natrinema salaciae]|uniref:endo-1,4-beta-xylanase n=1 Tax=Natrinema salaciae TaxID=1186196 RepID=A0A1H9K4C6_9EURY|nr:endo-1,4-beta-xylanase [Natrinema salaciae]SEQ93753.1 Endo-1,4-beta-xylanase, GH35 family [Natrinema salaciae]
MTTNDEARGEHDAPSSRDPQDTDADEYRTTDQHEATSPIDRRDYLRTVGAVGVLGVMGGLAGSATGSAAAQADWETEADRRIAEHRQGSLEVEVVDETGQPVPNADVDVEMAEHDYGFGYVLSANLLLNETEPGHPYRETLKEDFNIVWFGNYHKWRFFEENQEIADQATAWAKDNGLDIRGHVCLWANVDAWAVPGDVVDAMGVDHQSGESGADLDPQHVRDRSFEHVREIIEHYADFEYEGTEYGSVIEEWEVMNEVVHVPGMIRAVNGVPGEQESDDLDPVTAPVLAEWYDHARDVAPEDVGLATNDYNTMEGSLEYARSAYERQIEFLAENGSLDYAGIQSHFGDRDSAVSPEETLDVLDRYAQHGVRLRVTEYDATGDDWSDEEKADFFHDYLKTVFSHDATDAFLVAGGSDAHHWRDDAPFFYEDWTPKPAYHVYQDLVFDEWWTEASGTTDDSGTYATDAFLGVHEVTITVGGESTTEQVSVTDASGTTDLVVTPGTSTSDCEEQGGVQVGEHCARDPDDDSLYEDVNGDGQTTHGDVNALFENLDSDDIQGNADAFDFDGNGRIGFSDVISLLRDI